MTRILIIGAGLTGTATAYFLTKSLTQSVVSNAAKPISIQIWDKGRGVGGRFSTARANKVQGAMADHGAQYITPYSSLSEHYIQLLQQANILVPLEHTIVNNKHTHVSNYMAPQGVSTIPKYFIQQAQAMVNSHCNHQGHNSTSSSHNNTNTVENSSVENSSATSSSASASGSSSAVEHSSTHSIQFQVKQNTKLTSLKRSESTASWLAQAEDAIVHEFDAVILTLPVPQILNSIQGDLSQALTKADLVQLLQQVKYSSRFALICYYDAHTAAQVQANIPYAVRYVAKEDDDVIRCISFDSLKRNRNNQNNASILIHTSIEFGAQHMDNVDQNAVQQIILTHLHKLHPELPAPVEVKHHKWRYSQVMTPFIGQPGAVIVPNEASLILAGDSFTTSNFDGCLQSAEKAAFLVVKSLTSKL